MKPRSGTELSADCVPRTVSMTKLGCCGEAGIAGHTLGVGCLLASCAVCAASDWVGGCRGDGVLDARS